MSGGKNQVVRLEAAQDAMRRHFLGWQCRIRQLAMRQNEGRPSSGMRPGLALPGEEAPRREITVLIVQEAPETVTAEFRHMVRRTHDPADRLKNAIRYLSATYYQYPDDFSDQLTALFGPGSPYAESLLDQEFCSLHFEQYNQRYALPCRVHRLMPQQPAYQATYWHNMLFNRNLSADPTILAFQPDWAEAEASPPAH